MLQLLLEGGQGYDDIGSLLGIAPDEVRSRARSALTEIGGADPDAQVGLSDYLLGQADPIGRADAVRHLQSDPEANALAQRLVQNLRLLAPRATLPEIPEPRGGRRAAAPPPPPGRRCPAASDDPRRPACHPPRDAEGPGLRLARRRLLQRSRARSPAKRRTQVIVGGAAALVLVIVVVVVATSGGGGGGEQDCKPVDPSAAQQAGVPTMKLAAVGPSADAELPAERASSRSAPAPTPTRRLENQAPSFVLQTNAVPPPADCERRALRALALQVRHAGMPLGQETVDSSGNLTGGCPGARPGAGSPAGLPDDPALPGHHRPGDADLAVAPAQGKKATGVIALRRYTGARRETSRSSALQQLLQQAQSQAQGGGTSPAPHHGLEGLSERASRWR